MAAENIQSSNIWRQLFLCHRSKDQKIGGSHLFKNNRMVMYKECFYCGPYKLWLGWAWGINVGPSFGLVESPKVRSSDDDYQCKQNNFHKGLTRCSKLELNPPPADAQEERHCLELWEVLGDKRWRASETLLKQLPNKQDWSRHPRSALASRNSALVSKSLR